MNATADLNSFYDHVQVDGFMRTPEHAARWTKATLQMLGVNLDRKTKKALANTLPDPLSAELRSVFWLLNFRDTNISAHEFQNRVARRAGASDAQRARSAVIAVFHSLRTLIDDDLDKQVVKTLSPELRGLWTAQP
jgi:uncharacterized protein (DUF2267 family)